jgi:hypothetical protein
MHRGGTMAIISSTTMALKLSSLSRDVQIQVVFAHNSTLQIAKQSKREGIVSNQYPICIFLIN